MNLIKTSGHYGLILDAQSIARKEIGRNLAPVGRTPDHIGHFILLNRYKVDDEGYISLTPSLPLRDLYGTEDVFSTELLSLLEQAQQRFPIAQRN